MSTLSPQSRQKAVRQLTLAAALRRRPMTRRQIEDGLGLYTQAGEAARRQAFERDKSDLIAAGVEIEQLPGEPPAYRIHEALPPAFAEDELDALARAGGLVADGDTGAALAAFAAGADAFPRTIDNDRVLARVPDAPELLAAVAQRRAVRIEYRSTSNPPRERVIEPWVLRARRGLWYCIAWSPDAGEHRVFRLDRIVGDIVDIGEAEHPRPELLPSSVLPDDAGEVRLCIDERGLFDVERRGGREVGRTPDGVEVQLPSVRDEAAIALALRFDGTVTAPHELDDERRLRREFVHDLHSRPAPAVPPELDARPSASAGLDPERLRRMIVLSSWLSERQYVTLEEAARGFGCSEDELRDDIAVLQDVVLPNVGDVYDVAIMDDGTIHHVIEHAVPVQLSAVDRARVRSLLAAASEVVDDTDRAAAGLRRLAERLDDDVAVSVDTDDLAGELALLRRAREERRVVTFRYRNREGAVSDRRVTPTELAWLDGDAYVGGWDHGRGTGLTFRIDRIAGLDVGEVDDEPRSVALDVPAYTPRGDEVEFVVRCTHIGTWLLARVTPEQRLDLEDGSVWARVRSDTPRAIEDHVVVGGGEIEVVAPEEIRQRLVTRTAPDA